MSEPTAPAATEAPASTEPTGSLSEAQNPAAASDTPAESPAPAEDEPNQQSAAPAAAADTQGTAQAAEPDPEQLALEQLAQHLGTDKSGVTPSAVLGHLNAFKASAANTVAELEKELRALPATLDDRAKAALLHIKGRAQNGSAPDQDFVRTHSL